ncbi:13758_t:CDS:2 [Cetraspora pellucida]|uniref:13758_t:CDS:1 n=1 Tax=Cetraspora pellucida TaxID=1433469 RepID=A0A9N9AJC6_9GLOM|nr:13758_t:CDS:2 [Cetraspora pellucida]
MFDSTVSVIENKLSTWEVEDISAVNEVKMKAFAQVSLLK